MKRVFILLLFSFLFMGFSLESYSDVRCSYKLRNYGYQDRGYLVICENGVRGIVKNNTPLKAVTVQVFNSQNTLVAEKTVNNLPTEFNQSSIQNINNNDFVAKQITQDYPLSRSDRISIKRENGFTFSDDTVIYQDWDTNIAIGQLGNLDESQNAEASAICEYTTKPIVFRSDRCPKETQCSANVLCKVMDEESKHNSNVIQEFQITTTVICRAKGKKCPRATKCLLDDTQHIQGVRAENTDSLMESGYEQGDKPENINFPGALQ